MPTQYLYPILSYQFSKSVGLHSEHFLLLLLFFLLLLPLIVTLLYPVCKITVASLYPHCILSVSSLYPHCILLLLIVPLLYPHCTPTVSLMYTFVSPLYPPPPSLPPFSFACSSGPSSPPPLT